VQSRFFLDVVVAQGTTIFQLFSSEDKTLLVGGDAFLVLNLGLHILDRVGRFDIQSDSLTREGLDEDLHLSLLSWDRVPCQPVGNIQFKRYSKKEQKSFDSP